MYYTIAIKQTATNVVKDLHLEYGLIPTSRPVISPPSPQVKFEDVPGGSGSLDLSQVLTNEMSFYDRSGSLEFMLAPDSLHGGDDTYWEFVYSDLLNFLSPGRIQLWTSINPWGDPIFNNYFYEGRMLINDWKTDKSWEKVTLDYRLDPFKYANDLTETSLYTVAEEGTQVISITGITHVTIPTITLSKSMTVSYNSRVYTLPAGSSRIIALTNLSEPNVLTFGNALSSGSGTVQVSYRRMFL